MKDLSVHRQSHGLLSGIKSRGIIEKLIATRPSDKEMSDERLAECLLPLLTMSKLYETELSPDDQTVNKVISDNLPLAYYLAKRYENTPADYSDVVQQALLALDRSARHWVASGDTDRPFGPYASRIIRNELNRLFNKETEYTRNELPVLDEPTTSSGEDEESTDDSSRKHQLPDPNVNGDSMFGNLDRKELLKTLAAGVHDLTPELKELFKRLVQGEGYKEIMASMGINSKSNVSHKVSKGAAELRKFFRKAGYDVPPDPEIDPKTGRYFASGPKGIGLTSKKLG